MLYITPKQFELSESAKKSISYGDIERFMQNVHDGLNLHDGHDSYFHLAAEYGRIDIFSFLLTQGYKLNHRHNWAFGTALKNNKVEFVRFFLEHPEQKKPLLSNTELMCVMNEYLLYSIEHNLVDMMKYLVLEQDIISPSFLFINMENLIGSAIIHKRTTILEVLLEKIKQNPLLGNNIDTSLPINYWTMIAQIKGNNGLAVVQLLIEEKKLNFEHINTYDITEGLDMKSAEVKDYLLSYYNSFTFKNTLNDTLSASFPLTDKTIPKI